MVKTTLASLAAVAALLPGAALAATSPDPIGDLIGAVANKVEPILASPFHLLATLYHAGRGVGRRDSLGCKVIPMRTAAVDGVTIPRHSVLFIKETVGLPMPDGRPHDGYWYATDVGGDIGQGRIDLFTGDSKTSMRPLMPLNLTKLTVVKVGDFQGCPNSLVDKPKDLAAADPVAP